MSRHYKIKTQIMQEVKKVRSFNEESDAYVITTDSLKRILDEVGL